MKRKVLNKILPKNDLERISQFVSVRELVFEIQRARKKDENLVVVSDGNDGWTPVGSTGDIHVAERQEAMKFMSEFNIMLSHSRIRKDRKIKFRIKLNPKPFAQLSKLIYESIEKEKSRAIHSTVVPRSQNPSLSISTVTNVGPKNRLDIPSLQNKVLRQCQFLTDKEMRIGKKVIRINRPEVRQVILFAIQKRQSRQNELSKHETLSFLNNECKSTVHQFNDIFRSNRDIWKLLFENSSNNRYFQLKNGIQINY